MEIKTILEGLSRFEEPMIQKRRDFHRFAEPGWREFRTTAALIQTLTEHGIPVIYGKDMIHKDYLWSYPTPDEIDANIRRALEQGADEKILTQMETFTGCCALIETGRPGPVAALRFDIDCNPVAESCDAGRVPVDQGFASENEGFMHACGHDGHASLGLHICLALNEIKDQLKGVVKVIFQPAEEGVTGAQAVAESGLLDDVDYFFTSHLGMEWPSGTLAALCKGFLATRKIDAQFHGLSAHAGASPQDGKNAILAACSATLAMHTACQDSRGAARINVGTITGGTGRNVVADYAALSLETRGVTAKIEENVYARAMQSLEGAAAMFGCTVSTEIMGSASSADSDAELEPVIRAAAERVPSIINYLPESGFSGSEDATYLMARVQAHGGKAAYMGLGADIAAPHHNGKFDFDEKALLTGLKLYVGIIWEVCHCSR